MTAPPSDRRWLRIIAPSKNRGESRRRLRLGFLRRLNVRDSE